MFTMFFRVEILIYALLTVSSVLAGSETTIAWIWDSAPTLIASGSPLTALTQGPNPDLCDTELVQGRAARMSYFGRLTVSFFGSVARYATGSRVRRVGTLR